MLRITRIPEGDAAVRLQIEGRLTQGAPEQLRLAAEPCLRDNLALTLDLSAVGFAGAAGVRLLRELEARGAVLDGCSALLVELLRGDAAADDAGEAGEGDESRLVAALRRGDQAACEAFVRRNVGRMLATARRMLGNDEDARDVVQEAFQAALKAIGSFSGGAKLSTWLHRIVVNAALMKHRTRRRRPEEPIDGLLPCFDSDGHWVSPATSPVAPTEQLLARAQVRAVVRDCIARLPETYRTVLLLRDIEELDTEETATALGITTTAVKVRLHRARQALRTLLERALREGETPHEALAG
ncbi:MAG: sigma-70 family RNA polymerase sigma factor [Thermodesulfobacteriota bacterium]